MPYIEAKFTMAIDDAKKISLCEKLESAVCGNFRKPKTYVISELRDNVVIMRDGSFRAVVACKSINFDLMSDIDREMKNMC